MGQPGQVPPPSRQLTDFEARVYEYYSAMGCGLQSNIINSETWTVDFNRSQVLLESATEGPPARVTYRFTVTPDMTNRLGTLHGGCAATLIDTLSTCILEGVSKPGIFSLGGVTRNLKLTYLRPVPLSSEARLICEVVHVGRRLALLKAEIRKVDNGDLCVVGEHEKANTDPQTAQKI
ncbi:hypothetical protein Egran_00543 [Elaphomyces granulatus]|uniref:Thioesterase domain-containing protein n=1 Tax=Elaphomyces granulatus TaxID=519963 RepID=A0A232M5P1_9EURO|nr:hypothetical protein Egran_00543 [Elaphomyces granulatus]